MVGGRERREARSRALDCLEQLEILREGMSREELLNSDFNELPEFRELRVSCMVAGVPRSTIDTYGKICNDSCWLNLEHVCDPQMAGLVSAVLLDRAARLVRNALYHPRLTRTVSWWRVKRLRSIAWELYGPGPDMVEWTTSLPRLYRRWRHRIELAGELPGPVADQEPEARSAVTEIHQEIPDLLTVHGPPGFAVTPRMCTYRLPTSITKKQYKRRSVTAQST